MLTQQWALHYVLGPFDVGSTRKLHAVPQAVAKIVALTIERRGHPNYESGALQFFGTGIDEHHPIGSCRIVKHVAGVAKFSDLPERYLACTMTLETTETVTETLAQYAPVAGMKLHVGIGNADEILPDAVIADTEHPGSMFDYNRGW